MHVTSTHQLLIVYQITCVSFTRFRLIKLLLMDGVANKVNTTFIFTITHIYIRLLLEWRSFILKTCETSSLRVPTNGTPTHMQPHNLPSSLVWPSCYGVPRSNPGHINGHPFQLKFLKWIFTLFSPLFLPSLGVISWVSMWVTCWLP